MSYYGYLDLDAKVERYMDFNGGFFFEAGANDGITQSNTRHFEENRGWRGILVEPIPQKFKECVKNRPDAIVEWGALTPDDFGQDEVDLVFCNLMTITRGCMPPEQEAVRLEIGKQFLPYDRIFDFRAPALTISGILDKHGVTAVDFLSLDLEGFERPALRGLDFSRHRPRFILVEAHDEAGIDADLAGLYNRVDKLSHHDVLYEIKPEKALDCSSPSVTG